MASPLKHTRVHMESASSTLTVFLSWGKMSKLLYSFLIPDELPVSISFKVARDFSTISSKLGTHRKGVIYLGFPVGEHVNRMQFYFPAREQIK